MAESKICGHCHQKKPLTEFSPRRGASDGLASWCKACNRAATRRWYARKKAAKVANTPAPVTPFLEGSKTCPHCNLEKPLAEFYRDRRSKDGHTRWCRACLLAATRERDHRKWAAARLRREGGIVDLNTTRIAILKRLAAGEDHTLAAEDPLRTLGLVADEGGRPLIDALPRVTGEKTGGMRLCRHFAPARFYRPRCGDFCVQKFCEHWVRERSVCIDVDPAGNTYEVTEAHRGLLDEVGSDA